jgi:hypothetical protein
VATLARVSTRAKPTEDGDVTYVEISTENVAKWLPLAGLLVALKILPGKWKLALVAAGAGLAIWKYSEQG